MRAAPQLARTSARRGFATGPSETKGNSNNNLLFGALGAAVVGGGLYFYARPDKDDNRTVKDAASPQEVDYQAVYNAIADTLDDDNYDGAYDEQRPEHREGRRATVLTGRVVCARRRFLRPRACSSRLARVGHVRQEHWVRSELS